ncbi:MAG: hypothetical protein IJ682_09645 [Lachnospiraceae bacterium]|nr:hypothetical protein [Lachnospiraceae bacterium]
MDQNSITTKKFVKVLAILAGMSVAVCITSVIFYMTKNKAGADMLLDLGQSYLEDGDYEQAVASLEAILAIDPKQVEAEDEKEILENNEEVLSLLTEAYLGWIDDEVKQGNYDRAREILIEGRNKTNNQRFNEVLEELHDQYGVPIIESEAELVGKWQVDFKKTKEVNDKSIFSIYGGVFDSVIEFRDDMGFRYYFGNEDGYSGTWSCHRNEETIDYEASDVEGEKVYGEMSIGIENGIIYLIKASGEVGNKEYWSKADSENNILAEYFGDWENLGGWENAESMADMKSLSIEPNGMVFYAEPRENDIGYFEQQDNGKLICRFFDDEFYDNAEDIGWHELDPYYFSMEIALSADGHLKCEMRYEDSPDTYKFEMEQVSRWEDR